VSARLSSGANRSTRGQRWARLRIGLVSLVFVVALTVLLIVPLLPTGQVTYQVGDVARADIRAPRRLEYDSQIETERERKRAAAAVEDIYDPPETRVARQQIARAQEILAYINSVRQDIYATPSQRVAWIQAIPDPDLHLALIQDKIQQILTLNDAAWIKVRDEVVRVLDQAMRDSIREDELVQARADVPTLVDVRRMNDEEVAIVSTLVRGLLVPNTFVNVEQTEAARQKAREEVGPVMRTFVADGIVLREGDTITDLDLEALQALGVLQPETGWREVGGVLVLVLLTTVVLGLALLRYQSNLLAGRSRNVALVALLFILFVVLAKLMVPGRVILSYVFPAAALSMLVTVLLNPELAIIASLTLAALVGNIAANSLALTAYAAAGGRVAALVLRRVERVNAFFRAGVYVGLTNVAVVLVFRLPGDTIDPVGMVTLLLAGVVNGALSASLTLAVFFIVGNLFDITTALKLLELSQPSHPLLRQLLLKAPGTYHHTLMIANLAEQAAERIGANALLTRVGAFYHDIGKIARPRFFTENQMDGVNPHNRLDPFTSADILMSHVTDGLDLAKRYRLPSQVRAFINEHHGDSFVSFLYQKAVEAAGGDASEVDEHLFRYVGPKPQSRETALLMLADTAEALTKSKHPNSVEELDELVGRAIKIRMEQGQLDECDLTLRDLQVIRQSFVDTLKGLYHTRIEYPEPKPPQSPAQERATEEGEPGTGSEQPGPKPARSPAQESTSEVQRPTISNGQPKSGQEQPSVSSRPPVRRS
jgi:putative nucleotidyltransferase with HDIG domain